MALSTAERRSKPYPIRKSGLIAWKFYNPATLKQRPVVRPDHLQSKPGGPIGPGNVGREPT